MFFVLYFAAVIVSGSGTASGKTFVGFIPFARFPPKLETLPLPSTVFFAIFFNMIEKVVLFFFGSIFLQNPAVGCVHVDMGHLYCEPISHTHSGVQFVCTEIYPQAMMSG